MAERKEVKVPEKYVGKKIYSFSKINSFVTCPHAYYLGYIQKKKGTDNIYSVIGTLMHDLIEKLQNKEINNTEAVIEFNTKVFEITEILGYKFSSDKVRKNLTECLVHFLEHYKPIECKGYHNEFQFFTCIEGVVLLGYIDIIVLLHNDVVDVYDYKISTKYNKSNIAEHGNQLITYVLALENEYGIKVKSIKWNMLKYCKISWKGKTTEREVFCLRNEIVKSLRSELKKDLRELGCIEFEIDLILDKAEQDNDINQLPQVIQDKYKISDGYVEYPINEDTIKHLKDFIRENVALIESKNVDSPSQWQARQITLKENFYCSTLCSYKSYCENYQKFLQKYSGLV